MEKLQSKLNTACLVVIAISLAFIAYKQLQPVYIETENGLFLDTNSGKFYSRQNEKLVPLEETVVDRLRKDHPEGKHY